MTEVRLSNETRLPRAVRERSARIAAMLEPKPPGEAAATPPQADATPPAVTEQTDPPSSTQPQGDPRDNDPSYWRQRFKVTEGMLRTQREAQAAELERRDQELADLRQRVRDLEGSNQAPADKELHKQFFTAEMIDQFGEEQCQAMASAAVQAARSQVQAAIDAEVKPIREREQRQKQQTAMTKRQELELAIAEKVPDYLEIDKSPEWLEWLAQTDDGSGMVRQDILNNHLRAFNAAKVAGMFTAFKAGTARSAPPVAPSRGPGGGSTDPLPPATGSGRGYPTKEEIRDFSKRAATIKDPRDRRYVTDKERAEFEARLRLQRPA